MSLRRFLRRSALWRSIRRTGGIPRRIVLAAICLFVFIKFLLFDAHRTPWLVRILERESALESMPNYLPLHPLDDRLPCYGPRNRLLSESPDDDLHYGDPETPYPAPFMGSHLDLGVEQTWMTAAGRYGPYGYGEDKPTYKRKKVDWDTIDWGVLQDSCASRNAARFPRKLPSSRVVDDVRFTLRRNSKLKHAPQWNEFRDTRRTALVVRAYQGFAFGPEEMWYLRSLITEAALRTGGEYTVVILMHIQDAGRNIFNSKKKYTRAFRDANIPPELQSITLLWDDNLLESWYPAVTEHRTMWQANQPLQLFALHYPEYDHYWQLELDQRFLGDAGRYLDTLSAFARDEPRKQALERATFPFSEQVYGNYSNFAANINNATKGDSSAWGPIRIADVEPIGPPPPVANATEEDFDWGVGEDADVVVTSFCRDARLTSGWTFRDYIRGFTHGTATPRWWCPPAVSRVSRPLLLQIHSSQHRQGLEIPSEATFPTWALWLGLKISFPPQPVYMHRGKHVDETRDEWFRYAPSESPGGFSDADPASFADRGLTWWWASEYPRVVMDAWLGNNAISEGFSGLLAVKDGEVYAPNIAMHPVKK